MIQPNATPWEPSQWRTALAEAYRSPGTLLEALGLAELNATAADEYGFATLVPRGFAARMANGNRADPLLLQVLPTPAEGMSAPGFAHDALGEATGDLSFQKAPGLIQKYANRALLITTAGCAVHCRYCFRRHFPYAQHKRRDLDQALDYVAGNKAINEIILSGGDPLLLDDNSLTDLVQSLECMDHLERIRIHTRLPIVVPERVTQGLIDLLTGTKLHTVIVVHANHVNELDHHTHRAFTCLRNAGLLLLNQAVLLKNVNDSAAAQVELANGLFKQGVLPYYLHLPDKVTGTQHFYVDATEAFNIYEEMQAALSGYLLPRLVREVPGESSKRLIASAD